MPRTVMLSTFDNPYNPFLDFDNWLSYDLDHNHNCCGLLSRNANTSDALSDVENARIIERAIKQIIANDPLNIYCRIVEEN